MDVFAKPDRIDPDVVANLGPLAPLAGVWEGEEGVDVAPGPEGPVETRYRERLTLEPVGPVENGHQVLYGLRYATTAWPLGEAEPFHEEVGYWLWDPGERQVMRCFMVPRAVLVNAGGTAEPEARRFVLTAELGSVVYGILSNPFLDRAFRTVRYQVEVAVEGEGFRYAEDTQLAIPGRLDLFHHTDTNRLHRVA